MATKKEQDRIDDQWLLLIFAIIFVPFIVVALRHYKRMKDRFPPSDTSQRIFDTLNLLPPLSAGAAVVIATLALIYRASGWPFAILTVPIITIVGIWVACIMARWVASTYFGVVVDAANDTILLPKDMASYGISDYLNFQFIRDLGEMDILNLSSITKITREAGKHVYIHGAFGSRGMTFSNKQKRDECLAAIERGGKGLRTSPPCQTTCRVQLALRSLI
jgi:hypothetical protein